MNNIIESLKQAKARLDDTSSKITRSKLSTFLQTLIDGLGNPDIMDDAITAKKLIKGITVGESHGNYRVFDDVTEIDVHNGLEITQDPSHPDVVAISVNIDSFANKNLQNINPSDLDREIRLTNVFAEINKRLAGGGQPIVDKRGSEYHEEQGAVTDWSQFTRDILHLNFQFTSDGEVINQVLPDANLGKTIIVSSSMHNVSNCTLNITPDSGQHIPDYNDKITITKEGIAGVLIPSGTRDVLDYYEYIPYEKMDFLGLTISDDKNNIFLGMKSIKFDNATVSQDPNNSEGVIVTHDASSGGGSVAPSTSGVDFIDTITGTKFTTNELRSTDKSIRISKLPVEGGARFVADLSKLKGDFNEGIHVCLGNDQLLTSKYPNAKLYFSDTRVKGGMFVYPDMNTKSFVIQDTDPTDDPNVSGGTTFLIALYYEPTKGVDNRVSQDGKVDLEFVDDNDNHILDIDGNPMGVQISYKAGETLRPELYIGECRATAFTRVHLKVKLDFPTEEFISVSANTQLCIQSISKEESSGLALLSFMAYTGYNISFDNRYYGYNSMNLARLLVFNKSEVEGTGIALNSEDLELHSASRIKIAINNYHLTIKDNGTDLPVWDLCKRYSALDTHYLKGKTYKASLTITDKNCAFNVSLLKYSGTDNNPAIPHIQSYTNISTPVLPANWTIVDTLFISEDVVSGDHTVTKDFTIPSDANAFAIMLYPNTSAIPCTCILKDFEGDILPWFNKLFITNNSHISESTYVLDDKTYIAQTTTPYGYRALRFTCNSVDTKVPAGVITGGDGKVINDNSWFDTGSYNGNKAQGDFKFLTEGTVTMSYVARCFNEQSGTNNAIFWLAKVNKDGTFTEVPNSKYANLIEGNRRTPDFIKGYPFTFTVKANESYRMFMKSDKDDGFYIQSDGDGKPLFRADIEFKELITNPLINIPDFITITENGNAVDKSNYRLSIDSGTGKVTVTKV